MKINFHGATQGNLVVSSCGCIARDHQGNTLAFVAKQSKDGMNNVVECVVAKEALVMGAKLGIHRVHLEGASKIITNGRRRGKLEAWHLDKHIKQIKCLL